MMPFLLAETAQQEKQLPLSVYCVGSHEQKYLMRPDGFPAHQLFLTRRGRGTFRLRGGEEFILGAGSALMIRANTEHEYFPDSSEDQWKVGLCCVSRYCCRDDGGANGIWKSIRIRAD